MAAAILLTVALWALSAACLTCAQADSATPPTEPPPAHEWVLEAGTNAGVGPDQVVDEAFALDGDVIVAGAVQHAAVAVGGDVIVLSGGYVGGSAIAIGGHVVLQPGATVRGRVVALHTGSLRRGAVTNLVRPIIRPFARSSLIGWTATTALFMVLATLAALALPHQMAAVRDQLAAHFLASLGWGALAGGVLVPAVSVALLLTIVGIAVLAPLLVVVVPLLLVFGFLSLGALVGRALLTRLGRGAGNLALSAVLGVGVIHVVRFVPIAGALVWGLLWLAGFGATCVAVVAWLRRRPPRNCAAQ